MPIVNVTKISFEKAVHRKLSDYCEEQIGRRPKKLQMGGGQIILYFYPELSNQEVNTLKNNLPPFMSKMYDVSKTTVQYDTDKNQLVE